MISAFSIIRLRFALLRATRSSIPNSLRFNVSQTGQLANRISDIEYRIADESCDAPGSMVGVEPSRRVQMLDQTNGCLAERLTAFEGPPPRRICRMRAVSQRPGQYTCPRIKAHFCIYPSTLFLVG